MPRIFTKVSISRLKGWDKTHQPVEGSEEGLNVVVKSLHCSLPGFLGFLTHDNHQIPAGHNTLVKRPLPALRAPREKYYTL